MGRNRQRADVADAGAQSARRRADAAAPRRDLAQAGIAGLGVLLTLTMAWGLQSSSGLPYCGAGSACDIVQGSAWSRFLGIPLVLWGFGTYLMLGTVALWVSDAFRRARLLVLLATIGFGLSAYLTAVSYWLIGAMCFYCMLSFLLMSAAFALTLRSSAAGHVRRARIGGWAVALLLALAMHADARGWLQRAGPVDPALQALAVHLSEQGAKFYGASWCPHCQQQKGLFGAAAVYLPYVECSPRGPRGPRATECEMQEIKKYPTWRISGRSVERILSPAALAKISGFKQPIGEP